MNTTKEIEYSEIPLNISDEVNRQIEYDEAGDITDGATDDEK